MKILLLVSLLFIAACPPEPVCIQSHIEMKEIPEQDQRIGGGMTYHVVRVPAHFKLVEVCDQWLK